MNRKARNGARNKSIEKTFFCQKLFGRNEFLEFCTSLRQGRFYHSVWGTSGWTDFPNRLVVDSESDLTFPEFLSFFRSTTWSDPGYSVEWECGKLCSSKDWGKLVESFKDLEFENFFIKLYFSLTVDGLPVEFWFEWSRESQRFACFSINWFFGDLQILDELAKFAVNSQFGVGGKIKLTESFRKSRENAVREELLFLKGFRLSADGSLLEGYSSDGELLWQEFLKWYSVANRASDLKGRLFLRHNEIRTVSGWEAKPIRRLVKESGASSYCVQFDLQNLVSIDGLNHDAEYHLWLSSLEGASTLSGKCAVFGLGLFGDSSPNSFLRAYLRPEGFVIGYRRMDNRVVGPPVELRKLASNSDWVVAVAPIDLIYLPSRQECGEASEELQNSQVNGQMMSLRRVVKKWKEPVAVEYKLQSLEGQLNWLSRLGFTPTKGLDKDYFLDKHQRDWYEGAPFFNVLVEMGIRRTWTYCPRFWCFRLDEPEIGADLREVIAVLCDLTNRYLPMTWIVVSDDPLDSNSKIVEFQLKGKPQKWRVDGLQAWVSLDLIGSYNQLLVEYGVNHQIYIIEVDSRRYLIGGFNSEEVSELNKMLPKPFILISDYLAEKVD